MMIYISYALGALYTYTPQSCDFSIGNAESDVVSDTMWHVRTHAHDRVQSAIGTRNGEYTVRAQEMCLITLLRQWDGRRSEKGLSTCISHLHTIYKVVTHLFCLCVQSSVY